MAWRTKNGMATNACAMTTATHVNGIRMPRAWSCVPSRPMRPNAAKSAMPATAGGSTSGSSRRVVTTLRPGNRFVPEQVRHRRTDDAR